MPHQAPDPPRAQKTQNKPILATFVPSGYFAIP